MKRRNVSGLEASGPCATATAGVVGASNASIAYFSNVSTKCLSSAGRPVDMAAR